MFAKLAAAREAGQIAVWCFGLGTDPLTMATDLLAAAVFRSDVFDALFGGLVAANEEGRVVSWPGLTGVPFTAEVMHRFAGGPEPMRPAGAAVLELAWAAPGPAARLSSAVNAVREGFAPRHLGLCSSSALAFAPG